MLVLGVFSGRWQKATLQSASVKLIRFRAMCSEPFALLFQAHACIVTFGFFMIWALCVRARPPQYEKRCLATSCCFSTSSCNASLYPWLRSCLGRGPACSSMASWATPAKGQGRGAPQSRSTHSFLQLVFSPLVPHLALALTPGCTPDWSQSGPAPPYAVGCAPRGGAASARMLMVDMSTTHTQLERFDFQAILQELSDT